MDPILGMDMAGLAESLLALHAGSSCAQPHLRHLVQLRVLKPSRSSKEVGIPCQHALPTLILPVQLYLILDASRRRSFR